MTERDLAAIEAKQPLVDRWGMPWGSAIPWSVATEMDADIGRLTAEVRRLRGLVYQAFAEGAFTVEFRSGVEAIICVEEVWDASESRAALGDA